MTTLLVVRVGWRNALDAMRSMRTALDAIRTLTLLRSLAAR